MIKPSRAHGRGPRPPAPLAAALSYGPLALALLAAAPTAAQPTDPLAITGRDFAGVDLDVESTPGTIALWASRARVWTEEPFVVPSIGPEPAVQRILLEGDVRLALGGLRFDAERALVWLKQLDEPDAQGREVYQVFVYFDEVGTPTADPALGLSADRLAVRAVVSLVRPIELRADVVERGRARGGFVEAGERELAATLREQLGFAPISRPPITEPRAPQPPLRQPEPEPVPPLPPDLDAALDQQPQRPIFADDSVLTIAGGDITIARGDEENAVLITGGVTLLSQEVSGTGGLQLRARRAVIFLPPGPLVDIGSLDIDEVRGIYLEGDVEASDGSYTVRSPQVYFDVPTDRALLLDASFHTYDQRRRLPLYVRAETVRQHSADQWEAERVTLANSSFARPTFTLGATRVQLDRFRDVPRTGEQSTRLAGDDAYRVDARNITLNAAGVPVLYWPRYKGDPFNQTLRSIRIGTATGDLPTIATTWNAEGLFGVDLGESVSAGLLLDYHLDRSPAIGLDVSWGDRLVKGNLLTYAVLFDQGEDRLRNGARVGFDGEFRGLFITEQRYELAPGAALWADLSYVSDETFVDAFFDNIATERKPLRSGLFFRRKTDLSFLSLESQGQLNNFQVNEAVLQAPGYYVEKVPEASYTRLADDLFPRSAPGLATWSQEYRVGFLRLNFTEQTAGELGYRNDNSAQRALGIDADQSLKDRFAALGLDEDGVIRADTRHQLDLALQAGPVRVNPYLVGRATFWDERYEQFSPDEDDRTRFYGGVGTRISTTLTAIDNEAESQLLDVHRLRHVIEPSVEVFSAGATMQRDDIPFYDADVEPLLTGTIVRLGLDQTLQTKRGGPGRWRNVDLLEFDAGFVFTHNESGEAPIPRYVAFRPELSRPGDSFEANLVYRMTDAVAIAGSTIYDLDAGRQRRSSIGARVDHSPVASSAIELSYIDPLDSTDLTAFTRYEITDKYILTASTRYDFEFNNFKRFGVEARREFSQLIFGISVEYDNIQGTTGIGFVLTPKGAVGGVRLRGVGGNGGLAGDLGS